MSGDISRDFARSLSNLHNEVLNLKKLVADQATEIEDLKKQVTRTDDHTVKRQRARVQRALLTGGKEELVQAFNSAPTLADEELLRMSLNQPDDLEPVNFDVNQQLLDNMIKDHQQKAPLPVTITIEEKRAPQIQFNQDAVDLEMRLVEDKIQRSINSFEETKREQAKRNSNLLGTFNELWKTNQDWKLPDKIS